MSKEPKEILERIQRQQKEARFEEISILEATKMLEIAGKAFVRSKTKAHVTEAMAVSWLVSGLGNVIADLVAFSKSKGYIDIVEDLTIAIASQIHETASLILEEHKKENEQGESRIILPDGDHS